MKTSSLSFRFRRLSRRLKYHRAVINRIFLVSDTPGECAKRFCTYTHGCALIARLRLMLCVAAILGWLCDKLATGCEVVPVEIYRPGAGGLIETTYWPKPLVERIEEEARKEGLSFEEMVHKILANPRLGNDGKEVAA